MGFRSGEFGGQIISNSFTNPRDFKTAVVAFAACDGALSCMKTTLFSRDEGRSSNHGSSAVFKNSQYVAAVNFNPSGTRNGPTSSSPMMPAQIITPPPPCWRLILVWHVLPLYTQPLAQPSGPSNVALDSSVNSTKFISVFMYFFDHSIRKRRCLGVRGGFVLGLLIAATFLRRRLWVVFGTFTRPASSKIFALVAPGIFRMLLLNRRKSRLVTDFRTPRSHRGFLLEGLRTNRFTVPTWRPISLAIAPGRYQ